MNIPGELMKKTIFSILTIALLFGSEVFAVTVVGDVSYDNSGSLRDTQNLSNADAKKDQATANSTTNQLNTTFKNKAETVHKDPKDYPKKAH